MQRIGDLVEKMDVGKTREAEVAKEVRPQGVNPAVEILGQIIDRARLAKGWNPHPPDTQMLAIQTWFEILNVGKIPPCHYNELYRRATVQRSNVLSAGREPPDICPELLVAQWSNLKFEIERSQIDSGKFLPTNAVSVCGHCYGTGFRREYSIVHGRQIPGVVKCAHNLGEVINQL